MNYAAQSKQLRNLLSLRWPPVTITFLDAAPASVPRVEAAAPSGCTYWKAAAEGAAFYTEESHHYGCPIGAHTHGVNLPPEHASELTAMIETMVGVSYLKGEEVAAIPRREAPFNVAVYAPLSAAQGVPDVVIIRGDAKQMMLLTEAVKAAALAHSPEIMFRPTCAVVPEVIRSGRPSISLACIGNRVYNELGDDELYCALRGVDLSSLLDRLEAVANANRQLEQFHHDRQKQGHR
jgi:uncharacterized protein (DUF169 family)